MRSFTSRNSASFAPMRSVRSLTQFWMPPVDADVSPASTGGIQNCVSDRTERIGANEALFREVNERISRVEEQFGQTQSFEIVCECGRTDCDERFQITHAAYSRLRSNPLHFAVVPGHEMPE